jgi:endoglucanase
MKQRVILLLIIGLSNVYCLFSQTPRYPFPQNKSYFDGTVKPEKEPITEQNKVVTQFYNKWKNAYIRHDCADAQQYYVLNDEDNVKGKGTTICVSEGQGYGMLIMVLMAGYDKDAQSIFDGMYQFADAHPSNKSPYLMSWSILKGCVTNSYGDNRTSATDGDLDIALSLLMADNQWGSNGKINYRAAALKILPAILKHEVNAKEHTILLSDANVEGDYDFNDIRSSDFMPAHLRVFNEFYPNDEWTKVIDKMYQVFGNIQNQYSNKTGLLPDFMVYRHGKYSPAKAKYLESKHDGAYYYNACRVPFRVAVDFLFFGDPRAKKILNPISGWIQRRTANHVDKIRAGYHLNGEPISGHDYSIPAFVCPFAIGSMLDKNNQQWVNNCWDYMTDFEFKDYRYFDNTLQMLSMLILTGNYWLPQP